MTDDNGNYQLMASRVNVVIEFRVLGYKPLEQTATGNTLNASLAPDVLGLEEVVVIGYGTQRKGDVSSAISSIKSDDFATGQIRDAAELVKGKIAGLTIVNMTGDPNAVSNIRLRGVSSLRGNANPLILIDGIEGDLNHVAPENIESIDVLKDASAAAIYGTRGANGVILITTRSGRRGSRSEVGYTAYFSNSRWVKKMDFMTAEDVRAANGDPQLTQFQDLGATTDWLKEISRPNGGFTQNHSINLRGGTQQTAYSATFTYRNDKGTMNRSFRETMNAQADLSQFALNDMLKFHINIMANNFVRSNDGRGNLDRDSYANAEQVYRQAVIRNPTQPIYNPDGTYLEELSRFQYYNPVALQNGWEGDERNNRIRVTGDITFEPIKNWRTQVQATRSQSMGVTQLYHTKDHFGQVVGGTTGKAEKRNNNSRQDQLEITSRYNFSKGVHRGEGMVGYSYLYNVTDNFSANNTNFPTDFFLYNYMTIGSFRTDPTQSVAVTSGKSDNTLIGFFGRLSYVYDNRFTVLASIRREGSSRFGANNKWGSFPSISGSWNLHNESWMKSAGWLDILRVRLGYGISGNNAGSNYGSLVLYDYSGGKYHDEQMNWYSSLQASQNPNPNLRWEKTQEVNLGFDWSGFNNRIGFSIDLYNKNTVDLLYGFTVPRPPNMYTSMVVNIGKMNNRGVEVTINATPVKRGDFEWTSTLTMSHNANKLVSLSNDLYQASPTTSISGGIGDPVSGSTHIMEVGRALGHFWINKQVGWDENGYPLIEQWDAATESLVVRPWQNSISAQSRQIFGQGFPKLIAGWHHQLTYKRFDLTMQFTGQFFYYILNSQRIFYENNSIAYNRLKSSLDYHPAVNTNLEPVIDPATGKQKMVRQAMQVTQHISSQFLERGDFLKLSNFTFGYTLPFKSKVIRGARVYLSGQNMFTITGYSGIDPELNIGNGQEDSRGGGGGGVGRAPGVDNRDKYPTVRTFTLGLNINF